ncbi:MAG TPA: sulfatase-like hydrolase/transferase [Verrucomicrobiae bacterium]|jgi:arylsulfatase A-like enzyme
MKIFSFNRSLAVLTALMGCTLAASAADLASIFTNTPAPRAIPRRASIIVIRCHGLGYGDISCYGQTNFQTPNLDKLAAEGIRFNDFLAGSTNMESAQVALLSGKMSGTSPLNAAQTLQKAGYATAFLGEWPESTTLPWQQGFDEFFGFLDEKEGVNYYADHLWRFSSHTIYNQTAGREPVYENEGGKKGAWLPDFFMNTVVQRFITANQPDRFNHFRPFFLYLNLPAPRSATPGKDDFPVASDAPYSDEPWAPAAKKRAALLTRLDGNIGRLGEFLNQRGMTNNVIIFFTSSAPPEKFADKKLGFFQAPPDVPGQAEWRAPMLVRWPDHIPAGQVSEVKWTAADFLPTVAEIGYAKVPAGVTGKSIMPLLTDEPPKNQP